MMIDLQFLKTYCEGLEKSLRKIMLITKTSIKLQKEHLKSRDVFEERVFYGLY